MPGTVKMNLVLLFISKWKRFLETDSGIPDWKKLQDGTYKCQNQNDEISIDMPDSEPKE